MSSRKNDTQPFAYPRQLAELVQIRWEEAGFSQILPAETSPASSGLLPSGPELEAIFSIAYQASLMREEDRPVLFRLLWCDPSDLPVAAGPPLGLHQLRFQAARPLQPHELRKLAPAASYHRAMIGAWRTPEGSPFIWGIVQTGPRWLQSAAGGRHHAPPLPDVLIVGVKGPGHLEVSRGTVSVARLEAGQLASETPNVFQSQWLPRSFVPVRSEVMELHLAARATAGETWATLDDEVIRLVAQNMLKRLIATIRHTQHGGTIIIVPPHIAEEITAQCCRIKLKYTFTAEEPRARYRTLIVAILNRLAATYGAQFGAARRICWNDYVASRDPQIEELDEAVFEMANLIAALTSVDGAVVMTQRFEILGFAGEIAGALSDVRRVERALDLEGDRRVAETTENVGTRHRSAYRLCQAVPAALAIVVSQDGSVRFVTCRDNEIVYWEQLMTGVLEN